MKLLSPRWFALGGLLVAMCGFENAAPAQVERDFRKPPASARPWVFWYWMHGAVSREGVTADLEAMKSAGIGGAYLMPIKDVTDPPLFEPPVRQLSPEWWEMLRHAMSEANRLGLQLAMHACDGFATAGGPWITPDLAMQKVVWTETNLLGGRKIAQPLPQPQTNENFYRGIAVLAFPVIEGADISTRTVIPKVTSSLTNVDAQALVGDGMRFRSEQPCWALYEFAEPFTCRSIVIRPGGGNYFANRLRVEVSDDGVNFRPVTRLEPPRHGWQDGDADTTHSIVPVTAKYFRFSHDLEDLEPGAEDLDSAKWKNRLLVRQIELFGAPRIPQFEGKSGVVWRRSARATAEQLPDALCVPLDKIVNLTDKLDATGTLHWDAPPGRWTVMRFGYTPTGHRNDTAGSGKGLECDKFNPEAARVQFDGWFGETIRRVGPKLTSRVLKVFHVDSWEAGSQNWSPVFRDEFQRRRGYDPTSYLPAFAGVPIGSVDISERFLFDVRQTISDLTTENFFGTMARLAHSNGCVFSAEATAPTMTGDGMRHFSEVDIPMGEFWLRSPTHDKPNDIHDAISGARVYGKPIVQAEAFTELRMRWDEHPGMLKALGDHNFCLGVNRLVYHVFVQNPWLRRRPGVTLDGVGLYFQRDQTWWPEVNGWLDYVRRCQAMLQHGRPVADVAYFTGEEIPGRALLPERRQPPCPEGYAADSINRDALLRLARAQDGKLVLPGGASYSVLVLPDTRWMTPQVAAKLRELVRAGVIVCGPKPVRSPSLENFPACDDDLARIAAEIWDGDRARPGGEANPAWLVSAEPLPALLDRARVAPDVLIRSDTGSRAEAIEWTHRSSSDAEIYFLSNQRADERRLNVSFRVTGRVPELWDPLTGEMRAAEFSEVAGRTELPLRLSANGSVFVVFPAKSTRSLAPAFSENWIEPKPALKITGPWQVAFDPAFGGPTRPVTFETLTNWIERPEPGVRFYSGWAVYSQIFDWSDPLPKGPVWLDLGAVANLARVTLNGRDCGVVWTPPFRADITRALRRGENKLEVRVVNTWANRLIGDWSLPERERVTWTTAPFRLENTPLLPAGLFGPVRVLTTSSAAD